MPSTWTQRGPAEIWVQGRDPQGPSKGTFPSGEGGSCQGEADTRRKGLGLGFGGALEISKTFPETLYFFSPFSQSQSTLQEQLEEEQTSGNLWPESQRLL